MDAPAAALITGAGRRLGRAIADRLARDGARIAVHHRSSAAAARDLVADLRRRGTEAEAFAADLTAPSGPETLAAAVLDRFGPVGLLVNNASRFFACPIAGAAAPSIAGAADEFHALHVRAPLLLVHALVPGMRELGGGRVVNLGDARSGIRRVGHAPYSASKAALGELTRVLAAELAPVISVNMVAPGAILPPAGADAATFDLAAGVPAGRAGTPEEVAAAVAFFAGAPLSMTGQILAVSGGE